MRSASFVWVSVFALAGCADGTGPGIRLPLPVAVSVTYAATSVPISVVGGIRSLVVQGGPGMSCGVNAADGAATKRGDKIVIDLVFRGFDICPFAPTDVSYSAIVSNVSGGWYDVEVRQHYSLDGSPDGTPVVFQSRVEIL